MQGLHFLIEIQSAHPLAVLNDGPQLEKILNKIAVSSGMKVIKSIFHAFIPIGITGILLLEESHLSIHTWPELNYAAMDLFTCNLNVKEADLAADIQQHFEGCIIQLKQVPRGFTPYHNEPLLTGLSQKSE